jgi:hypothetical protein
MHWLRNSLSVLGVAGACALVAPGCQDNESMLFIVGVLAVETTNCLAKPERGATLRAGGALDTSLASGYRAALLVGSQLTQRGSREQLRTETARLSLEGAEVTLNDAAGAPLDIGTANPFSTLGTGFVDPAGGTDPGFGVIFVDVIPGAISDKVAQSLPKGDGIIVAKIRAFGTTLGGQEVESGDYTFPLRICNGCLVSYPNSANSAAVGDEYLCQATAATAAATPVCFLGQDVPVPCTMCSGALEVCLHPCSNCSIRKDMSNDTKCMGAAPAECQ